MIIYVYTFYRPLYIYAHESICIYLFMLICKYIYYIYLHMYKSMCIYTHTHILYKMTILFFKALTSRLPPYICTWLLL